MIYRTKDEDVLDALCTRHYGGAPYDLGAVLEANPGLAALGPVLPSGVLITLPEAAIVSTPDPTVRLWN